MGAEQNFIDENKVLWDAKTNDHIGSAFYQTAESVNGLSTLRDIESDLQGDESGKAILHRMIVFRTQLR